MQNDVPEITANRFRTFLEVLLNNEPAADAASSSMNPDGQGPEFLIKDVRRSDPTGLQVTIDDGSPDGRTFIVLVARVS